MKLKVAHFNKQVFKDKLQHLSHLDFLLFKTIPIYWGCSNIGDYFDIDGIITFDNVDDLIYKTNQLNESYYENRKEIINKNWKLALEYVNYEQNLVNTITNIFKHNNIL
jgi:hypothetical protein